MGHPELELQILAKLESIERGQVELLEAIRGLQRTRAGLEKGRAKAIEQKKEKAAGLVRAVKQLADEDAAKGNLERGRAGRISRRMPGIVSERQVKRILDRLFSMSDSPK